MRRFLRAIARSTQGSDTWPVVLLLLAVVLPVVCLLWFMNAAMRNERLAARQKLADAYRAQLSAAQTRLERYWQATTAELENLAGPVPGPAAFAKCVLAGAVESAVILDEQRRVIYPNTPSKLERQANDLDPRWTEANALEYFRKDFSTAAHAYGVLAGGTTNLDLSARAFQAQARCLVQAGRTDAAIQLINEALGGERFRETTDAQGRLMAANAELMALELMTNRASPVFQATSQRLKRRLLDYENLALAAPQRRFLMKELQKLDPDTELPTLAAELLAAQFCDTHAELAEGAGLHRAPLAGMWQALTPNQRVLALFRADKLTARLQVVAALDNLPAGAEAALLPPGLDNAAAFVSLPAGEQLPGWRLALTLKDPRGLDARMEHRTAIYLWAGMLVVVTMGLLALLAIRLVRRQTALSRLKNHLAATVSHELRTPLSAMRVLVDTLLEAGTLNEQTTREYLQLISQENERLSRLIQNFLTFSRMERKKHTFHFTPLATSQVIDAALAAVRDRLQAPGCRFEVQIEESLPAIVGDQDALVTALINLLDNACKYTEEIKHIRLRAGAENGRVFVSVVDNGIGIAPREVKKIFRPFHQVDPLLSRQGNGCGLGLSIVQFIVAAHGGSVSVASQPGGGSTFTISFPAVLDTTKKQAIA